MTTILFISAGIGALVAGTMVFMMAKANKGNLNNNIDNSKNNNNENKTELERLSRSNNIDISEQQINTEISYFIDNKINIMLQFLMSLITVIGIAGTVYFILNKEFGLAFFLVVIAAAGLGIIFTLLALIPSINYLIKSIEEKEKEDDRFSRRY